MLRQEMSIYGEMERGWKPNIVEISPACPRCGSSNTKFCYYNNYSLTQPRYFCKGCRRYWTKGGSLRNVPVGGGCRKSRRTRLLRASLTSNGLSSSRSFGVGNSVGHDHEMTTRYSESSGGSTDGSNIDLASVYANFLNNKQEPEQEQTQDQEQEEKQERELGLPPEFSQFSNTVGPTCEFSSVYENVDMDYFNAHQLLSNGNILVESRRLSISNEVSNSTFLGDQNGPYFCGIAPIDEHQDLEHCFMGTNDHGNSYVLPLLPEVDGVSDGMVWPISDVNLQNDIPKAQDPSQGNINRSECLFDISDYGIFSGLGK